MPINPDAPEEPIKASELGNNMVYRCPKCKAGDCLDIYAVINTTVRLCSDGTDDSGGDTEWDDKSTAHCGACGWGGQVGQLLEEEVDDDN